MRRYVSMIIFLVLSVPVAWAQMEDPTDRRLSDAANSQLQELKQKGDLAGILKFWEAEGDEYAYQIDLDIMYDFILSFPEEKAVPIMMQGMKSTKTFVANECIRQLSDLGVADKEIFEYVNSRVFPPAPTEEQRKEMAEAAKDLGNSDYSNREAAYHRLVEMGPATVEVLRPLTKGGDAEVARSAAEIIEQVTRVERDELWAFAHIGKADSLPALRVIVKEGRYGVKCLDSAIDCLGEQGAPEDAALIRPYLKYPQLIDRAAQALGHLKDVKAVPELLRLARDPQFADSCLQAVGEIGNKSVTKELEETLAGEEKFDHRIHYINALAMLGERKYLQEAIQKASEDDFIELSSFSYDVVGPGEMDILVARLNEIDDPLTVSNILRLIDAIIERGGQSNETVIKAIRDARKRCEGAKGYDRWLASNFSVALLNAGDKEEEAALMARATGPDPKERYDAIAILGGLLVRGRERFVELFMKACDDTGTFQVPRANPPYTQEVRSMAIAALSEIAKTGYWRHCRCDNDYRVRAIKEWYEREWKARGESPVPQG